MSLVKTVTRKDKETGKSYNESIYECDGCGRTIIVQGPGHDEFDDPVFCLGCEGAFPFFVVLIGDI